LAINEALRQLMEADPSVVLMGQGVKSPWYVGNTADGLLDRFGPERVRDTPVSENAVTGAAVGAAIAGLKPIVEHPRADFSLFAFDPIINQAANWRYMSGGVSSCPVVFWCIMNRGGEQAAQHSQALHGLFAHIPGLKVVMPATPYDAKGLLVAAVQDPDPVVFVDDRWLYGTQGIVPEACYHVPIGQAAVRTQGDDLTIISISYGAYLAVKAAAELAVSGIHAETIDLRTAKPLDVDTLVASIKRTGRALVVDYGWRTGGLSAEISARLHERCFAALRSPVQRLALQDIPAPAARTLEAAYYFGVKEIVQAARHICANR
jgi:pyruvate dehydrogenase E1 component beta subunit